MYEGRWVTVAHPTRDRERPDIQKFTRIHDDDAAQAVGFREGIVGGITLVGVTTGAIDASLGQTWYEGGLYSVRHRNPSYAGDFRVVWKESQPDAGDAKKIDFHLEARDGNISTHGWAAIAETRKQPVPPWEKNPVIHKSTGEDVLPEMKVGSTRPPFEAVVSQLNDAFRRADTISDISWWHSIASPWGDPILTPFDIATMVSQEDKTSPGGPIQSPRLRTTMDAGVDIVIYHPLYVDRTYIVKPWLCDKWQTPRSVFFCTEYSYEDESGKLVAIERLYCAHLTAELASD